MKRRSRIEWAILLVFYLCLAACGGLPEGFENLSLSEKIAAYERNFQRGGLWLVEARSRISWHGWEAADLLVQDLADRTRGLPDTEVLIILEMIQTRGCDLRGSAAEVALEGYLHADHLSAVERREAEVTLRAIREAHKLPPGMMDGLRGGPCEEPAGSVKHFR